VGLGLKFPAATSFEMLLSKERSASRATFMDSVRHVAAHHPMTISTFSRTFGHDGMAGR